MQFYTSNIDKLLWNPKVNNLVYFSFADETEVDVFLEFPCFHYDPVKNRNRPHFLGLKIHWGWWLSPEIKRHLLLQRKAMTNLDSILKSRDITLPTKVYIIKAMVFPVAMYGCERRLSTKELMLLNCGAAKDSWMSLGSKASKS